MMMEPIFSDIDRLGRSYLSTWVDTGSDEDKVNLSHHPGFGFWYRQGYNPLSIEECKPYVDGLRQKHESGGIFQRRYELAQVDPHAVNAKLYGADISRRCGPRGTPGYHHIEHLTDSFAVMPHHYETGWTGIIMVRDPARFGK